MNMTETIDSVAHLARLEIETAEREAHAQNFKNILDLIDQMNTVDTGNTQPMAHPLNGTQALRADHVTEKNQRATFQKLAPSVAAGLYLVPKVIE